MKKISSNISDFFASSENDDEAAMKAWRAFQVLSMWEECVEELFLYHTNSVYIIKEKGIRETELKILIVNVDESIFAAELNARRELIRLKFHQLFNEDIDEFRIFISKGAQKKRYPYRKEVVPSYGKNHSSFPLTEEEMEKVRGISSLIEDERLRTRIEEAIKSDWEWKKGIEAQ
jgi:hypothetical protein